MPRSQTFYETALLPDVIAETIISEKRIKLNKNDLNWFLDNVNERMQSLFQHNEFWRKKLSGKNSLDYAYSVIEHWLESFCLDPDWYRKRIINR